MLDIFFVVFFGNIFCRFFTFESCEFAIGMYFTQSDIVCNVTLPIVINVKWNSYNLPAT